MQRFCTILATAILIIMPVGLINWAHAQQTCIRIMKQDSTLNNLVDPPGYQTITLGSLGEVVRAGTGTQPMILIAGLGFGAHVFDEYMAAHEGQYRMFAVTLPGFGGTHAPPCPREGTSFGEQTWTSGALSGVEKLIEDEHIENAVVVGHWLGGTQIAVRLAAKRPEKVKAVILMTGTPRWYITDTNFAKYYGTPEKRVASIDGWLATKWFKTVTRETWDDNNFLPQDYAVNPVRALRLWREAATPKLHVWVRYLCEFNAQDLCPVLSTVTVPTLVLKPGLDGLWYEGQNYMEDTYCLNSWNGCVEDNPRVRQKTIPNSRACMWFDQPVAVDAATMEFLSNLP
jgi:pimeloyl-ACP methyl ester carboxylesterase